jgi:pimeloyl-ACP methyl ester carboxylesterase
MRIMSRLLLVLLFVEVALPLLIYLGRNHLIFFPSIQPSPEAGLSLLRGNATIDIVRIPRPDGRLLAAYDVQPRGIEIGGPMVVFFHGNAGNIGSRAGLVESFATGTATRTLLVDYSGYGGNPGSPSEEEVYHDGLAVMDYLQASGIPSQNIVLYGESLGGAVAIYVASQRACAGLVVQSSFSSMSSMAFRIYPWLPLAGVLASGSFPNAQRISELEIPILVVHGDRDEIIPFEEGQKLHAAAPDTSQFLAIEGAGHNDFFAWAGDPYLRMLGERFSTWTLSLPADKAREAPFEP